MVADVGMFSAATRMPTMLAYLGERGFELVGVYDKASNWWRDMEKGFMLFKRAVPPGTEPDGPWCEVLHHSTLGYRLDGDGAMASSESTLELATAAMSALAEPPDHPEAWLEELCRRIDAGSPVEAAAARIPLDWK